MPANVRRSSGAGRAGHPPVSTIPSERTEPRETMEEQAEAAPRAAAPWTKDWREPTEHPQMSAIWPILWLGIPLLAMVVYGYLSGP
jgi:hypothetical protein